MAEQDKSKKRKLVVARKRETVRERANKSSKKDSRTPRTRKLKASVMRPVNKAGSLLTKEFTPLKTGESKVGRVLGKKRSFAPSYFVLSFKELLKVTWPTKKTAAKLTFAVIIFSVFMATAVKLLDLGFDKLFKDVILK